MQWSPGDTIDVNSTGQITSLVTPLHLAIIQKKNLCAFALLNHPNINVNVQAIDGDTPLILAALYDATSIFEGLLYPHLYLPLFHRMWISTLLCSQAMPYHFHLPDHLWHFIFQCMRPIQLINTTVPTTLICENVVGLPANMTAFSIALANHSWHYAYLLVQHPTLRIHPHQYHYVEKCIADARATHVQHQQPHPLLILLHKRMREKLGYLTLAA